jgi:hypothetical protein
VIWPSVSVGFDMVAATMIAAIDQHITNAGGRSPPKVIFGGLTNCLQRGLILGIERIL